MAIKPIGSRVVIELERGEHNEVVSPGGIIIPDTVKDARQNIEAEDWRRLRGTVLAVGEFVKDPIKPGMYVLFDDYGTNVEHEGKQLTVINEMYIIGEIDDDNRPTLPDQEV